MSHTNKNAYVYFGVTSDVAAAEMGRAIVKIGYSADPAARFACFPSGMFDWHESFVLVTTGSTEGRKTEQALHRFLSAYQVPREEVPFGESGRGEWFELDAITQLKLFLKERKPPGVIKLEKNYFYAHAQGASNLDHFRHVTRASKDRDALSAARMTEAIKGLVDTASMLSVGTSPAAPGELQLHLKTISNPLIIQKFHHWLTELYTNAQCRCERTFLISEFLTGDKSAFIRFIVIARPPLGQKIKGKEAAIEKIFIEPIKLLRSLTGEHHTSASKLLRRHDIKARQK